MASELHSYADLAERPIAIGVPENEKKVNNKIARGALPPSSFFNAWKPSE